MSQIAVAVKLNSSLKSAFYVMLFHGIEKLPVIGGDYIVGILSLTDIAMRTRFRTCLKYM